MEQNEQHVSTEAQRMALEAMSAQLIHKLNAMIAEQEARALDFARQHHTAINLPQPSANAAPIPEPEPSLATPPLPPRPMQVSTPATREPRLIKPALSPEERPLRLGPKKQTTSQAEDNNIGMGIIIFSLVGIIMLLRSCT